jgi:hypothetical protein
MSAGSAGGEKEFGLGGDGVGDGGAFLVGEVVKVGEAGSAGVSAGVGRAAGRVEGEVVEGDVEGCGDAGGASRLRATLPFS